MDKRAVTSALQEACGGAIFATPKQIARAMKKDFRNIEYLFEGLDFLPNEGNRRSRRYLIKDVAGSIVSHSEPTPAVKRCR